MRMLFMLIVAFIHLIMFTSINGHSRDDVMATLSIYNPTDWEEAIPVDNYCRENFLTGLFRLESSEIGLRGTGSAFWNS